MLLFEAFDDILSVEEASVALKMGKNSIYELLLNKEIRGFKNGRVWRISKAELTEYVKKASKM